MCCVSASFLHYLKTFSRWITDLTCTYTHCRPTAGYKHATDVCTLMKSVYKKGFSSCGLNTKCNKFFSIQTHAISHSSTVLFLSAAADWMAFLWAVDTLHTDQRTA